MYTLDRLFQPAANATLDRPLDHLVACHGRIEERLATLERAGEVLESRPADALDAIEACFRYFETNGVLHTQDEEESAFPRIMPRLAPAERADVERLERQHREADALFGDLKSAACALRGSVSPEAAARYREVTEHFCRLYRSHIDFENRELIGLARSVLSPEDLAEISLEMKRRRGLVA